MLDSVDRVGSGGKKWKRRDRQQFCSFVVGSQRGQNKNPEKKEEEETAGKALFLFFFSPKGLFAETEWRVNLDP